jgi:prophage tail gpP-like protein
MNLYINEDIFSSFSRYRISLIYNAVASSFRFDALRDEFPTQLTYPDCEIYNLNDELLITGTIVNDNRRLSASPELISVEGYSKPGILEDVNIPIDAYPLQTDKLSLERIVDKLFGIFNIDYTVDSVVSSAFKKTYNKVNASHSTTVKDFINSLASQRGIIMSHDAKGRVLFTRVLTDNLIPVMNFEEGNTGTESYTLNINGQSLHSDITVLKQASINDKAIGQSTVKNPMIAQYRPKVKVSNAGDVFDADKAARMELSAELSRIKIIIETTEFVKPGNLITVQAPSLNIHNPAELFIESTIINGTPERESFTLSCVMKEVYNFQDVKNIFE